MINNIQFVQNINEFNIFKECESNIIEIEQLLEEGFIDDSKEKLKTLFNNYISKNKNKIDKNTKTFKNSINIFEKRFKQVGINTNKIKNRLKKEIDDKQLVNEFNDFNDSFNFKKNINNKIQNFFNIIRDISNEESKDLRVRLQLDKEITDKKTDKILEGFIKALFIFCILYISLNFISLFFIGIFTSIGLSNLLYPFIVIILAPILEEISKYISIKVNSTYEFFIIFNVIEFSMYTIAYMNAGMPFLLIAFIRLLTVGLHLTTTLIQSKFIKKSEESNDKKYEKIGLFIGILVHALWNLNAVVTSL